MSIKASLSSDGLDEVYTAPTLREMCLYKCLTNKDILTKEVEVDEDTNGSEKLVWEKFRLKEPIQSDLVEALLDAGDKCMVMLTPKYAAVLAAIRMSQPEHLVKIHVNNTVTFKDWQLEFLLSGGNVKSLDIHGCNSLGTGSLDAINKFGNKLEYLRIGNSVAILPQLNESFGNSGILTTPNLKTFIVNEMYSWPPSMSMTEYLGRLLQDFISNLEDLRISRIEEIQNLEFLEPAKTKLTHLTLSSCEVIENAWASLFKLDKLRHLDLVDTSIGEALVGEKVVERLLTALPNLTRLLVDRGLVKDIHVDAPIRGQGSVAKRLEFLGIMDSDEAVLRKAKLLANEVAHFGTVEGELRMLQYFSNNLNCGYSFYILMESLLERWREVGGTLPWKSVAVINLVLKTFKNNDLYDIRLHRRIMKKLVTSEVAPKLGEVLIHQCIGIIFWPLKNSRWWDSDEEFKIINCAITVMINLDGKLNFDHYATLMPTVMQKAEVVMRSSVLLAVGLEDFKGLLKKIAQLLEKAVDRFPEETDELWGISSILAVLKQFKEVMLRKIDDDDDSFTSKFGLVEILSSMIASLRKLCINSGPRRAAFHSAKGVAIVMELLADITDGYLAGLADPGSFALLEILKSIVQDTKLDRSESRLIAPGLQQLLLSNHARWKLYSLTVHPSERETTLYLQQQSIVSLLKYLESDPRSGYKASNAVNEIMMDLINVRPPIFTLG